MTNRVVLLSIPQLRRRDVTPGALASLEALSARGAVFDLVPAFPGLAASSFATLITGVGAETHGLIGNTYFDRDTRSVVQPPLHDSKLQAPRVWERLRERRPGARTMLWFGPNSEGASVEVTARLDAEWNVHTDPASLASSLVHQFGPFPRPRRSASEEPPRLEATTWILRTAAEMLRQEKPDLAIVRVPYLGQVARRFGPDSREACRSIAELDSALGPFLRTLTPETAVLAVTESVSTPVSDPIDPNRILRKLGLLRLAPAEGGGLDIDLEKSAAFAVADHQLCHIYVNDPSQAAAIASAFSGEYGDGVAVVAPNGRRSRIGLNHPRSGDLVLVAHPDRWFRCDWWDSPAEIPKQHPCMSGLTAPASQTPIDPAHVKGSMGAPPPSPDDLGVLVASRPELFGTSPQLTASSVSDLVLKILTEGTS